ncbi:hypothetical protein SAY87_005496 [Trapa incisa]|uniref:Uncharacterized protein n=1 Tax=Trapa incisa TaxID=236973 RepID=A0AAN7K308_9MYRT|nr:hypothetical protein SAY87_005496 [Trapa incisa]
MKLFRQGIPGSRQCSNFLLRSSAWDEVARSMREYAREITLHSDAAQSYATFYLLMVYYTFDVNSHPSLGNFGGFLVDERLMETLEMRIAFDECYLGFTGNLKFCLLHSSVGCREAQLVTRYVTDVLEC